MARSSTTYVCQACGAAAPKWAGRCDACGEWNTLVQEDAGSPLPGVGGASMPKGRAAPVAGLKGETVDAAMGDLLDADPDRAVDSDDPTEEELTEEEPSPNGEPEDTTTTTPDDEDASATELIERADELFAEADERLADRDLAGYEELMSEAVDLVRRASELLSGTTTTATTAPGG